MPSVVFALAHQTRTRPHPSDRVLVLFPHRVEGPQADPIQQALGLCAAFEGLRIFGDSYPSWNRLDHLYAHPWLFPKGSYALMSREEWGGTIDATTRPLNGRYGFVTPVGTWERIEAFAAPQGIARNWADQHSSWKDPQWDSIAVGVLLGAIEAKMPLAFSETAYESSVVQPWMYALTAATLRSLRPWLNDPSIPTRGYGSRPFPLTASAKRAATDGSYALLGYPKGSPGYRSHNHSFVDKLYTLGVVVPNAPYGANAWVKGPRWEAAVARFPQEVVDAGRTLGAWLPNAIKDIPIESMVEGVIDGTNLTRHQHLAMSALLRKPALDLKVLLPAYARGRQAKTPRSSEAHA